ncbi:class I SAM-dependent methyltransferase [Aquitalea pelogenes]|uniref:class I SAM-dependent methyltransferase n=1 Tax=Aquitalea pelogenes TaxID=1293573 RepID=UPI001956C761|nr:hypothetical protein [Aquitalea pelogenes]
MPGYLTKQQTVSVDGTDYLVRSLLDSQQYSDPLGEAEQRGISPASWPLFGLLWPSARVLALLMSSEPLLGLRVLEIGAGLALASMVVHRRHGDVTVSDWHRAARISCGKTCCSTTCHHCNITPVTGVAAIRNWGSST